MTATRLSTQQHCTLTFEVYDGDRLLSVFIARTPTGGGEYSYAVRRGQASDVEASYPLAKGLGTRLEALRWIADHIM